MNIHEYQAKAVLKTFGAPVPNGFPAFTPEEAVEARIANAVLPAGEVIKHARRMAERFNALPPGAVRETKKLLRRSTTEDVLKTIAVEGELFGARLRSPEAMEAFQAFFQKRQPDFSKFS